MLRFWAVIIGSLWVIAAVGKTHPTLVEHAINSKVFQAERTIDVRLPANFDHKRAYSTLYVLAANDFYMGNIFQDTVNQIAQLERYNEIPELIVIGVNSDAWYQETINNAAQLTVFLTEELPQFMQQQYPLLKDPMLMAHSYAGAYLTQNHHQLTENYRQVWAISPVFPSISFITQVVENTHTSFLVNFTLYLERGNEFDLNILNKQLLAKASKLSIKQHIIDNVGHHSVVPIALTNAIKAHFQDYELLASDMLSFDTAEIANVLQHRAKKYGLPFAQEAVNDYSTSIAQELTKKKKFKRAFQFWQQSNSRHRHYFINRWAERFQALGDEVSAQIIWQNMIDIFPNSPFPLYQLTKISLQNGDQAQASIYQRNLQRLYQHIAPEDNVLFSAFANRLLTDGDHERAITLLTLLAENNTENSQLWQNLAEAYKQIGEVDQAQAINEQHGL